MRKLVIFALSSLFFFSCDKHETVNSRVSVPNSGPLSSSFAGAIRWNNSLVTNISGGLNINVSDTLESEFTPSDLVSGLNPIEQMQEEWNNSSSSFTFFSIPNSSTSNKDYDDLTSYNDSEMGIYKSTKWFSEVGSSALAITQFYGIRKNQGTSQEFLEIIHADIIFNFKNFSFSTDPSDVSSYDFHSVILHELGHFLGLDHETSAPSVMNPFLAAFDNERSLYSTDVNNIIDNYTISSSSGQFAMLTSASTKTNSHSNKVVRGIIELRANGECLHYEDGKLVEKHKKGLTKSGL